MAAAEPRTGFLPRPNKEIKIITTKGVSLVMERWQVLKNLGGER
jgi:hypothetical protein